MNIDTATDEARLRCLHRYRQRVEDLRRAASQAERIAIFERIAEEVNIHEARTCWSAAFPKKKESRR
jgi:uncharacterized protein YheU (UPF0270 family)